MTVMRSALSSTEYERFEFESVEAPIRIRGSADAAVPGTLPTKPAAVIAVANEACCRAAFSGLVDPEHGKEH